MKGGADRSVAVEPEGNFVIAWHEVEFGWCFERLFGAANTNGRVWRCAFNAQQSQLNFRPWRRGGFRWWFGERLLGFGEQGRRRCLDWRCRNVGHLFGEVGNLLQNFGKGQ